jgi:hypothetical protein
LFSNICKHCKEREHIPVSRVLGPLPENAFVAAARDSIPPARERITTATKRGSTRGGRGRGRAGAPKNPKATEQGSRGRGKRKRGSVPADQGTSARRIDADIPDLNETIPEQQAQEVPVTQNAPTQDDFWF